jgi:uncharacterized protein YfaS (alpha-2-macroglobulin family)
MDNNYNQFSAYTDFYSPVYTNAKESYLMTDKRSTLCWKTLVMTNTNGTDTVTFFTGDESKAFIVLAEGISQSGTAGSGEARFFTIKPLQCKVKIPKNLQEGDKALILLLIENNSDVRKFVTISSFDNRNTFAVKRDTAFVESGNFRRIMCSRPNTD